MGTQSFHISLFFLNLLSLLLFLHYPERVRLTTCDNSIFEMQDRGIAGFLSCCLFGIATMIAAPYYAVLWGAPLALVFTYVLPALPAVLVFDGWMSCLRTRTADEVEALLRTCGAEGGEAEIAKWEIKSGSEMFMWPVGYVNWIICVKR